MAGTTVAPTPDSDSDMLFKLNPVHPTDLLGALEAAKASYQFYAGVKNLELAKDYRVRHRTWVQNYVHFGKDKEMTIARHGAIPQPPMAVEAFVADDLSRMELRPTTTPVMDPLPIPPPRPEPPDGNIAFGPKEPWWPVQPAYYATAMTTVPAGYETTGPEGLRYILRVLNSAGTGMRTALWEAL